MATRPNVKEIPSDLRSETAILAAVAREALLECHVRHAVELVELGRGRVPPERMLQIYARLHFLDAEMLADVRGRTLANLGERALRYAVISPVNEPPEEDVQPPPVGIWTRVRAIFRGRIHHTLRREVDRHTGQTELALADLRIAGESIALDDDLLVCLDQRDRSLIRRFNATATADVQVRMTRPATPIDRRPGLERALADAGVAPDEVDVVIASHLHFDHVGGLTTGVDGTVRPTFPNAMHYVRRAEWEDATHPHERNRASYLAENFVAITDPGSELEKLARQRHFRHIFFGFPDIGGRYSALSAFGLVPAMLMGTFPAIAPLNIMRLHSPTSAILSAVIFNALIIIALIPLSLKGVAYRAIGAGPLLRRNLLIYGVGGIIVPFVGIKLIDLILVGLRLA